MAVHRSWCWQCLVVLLLGSSVYPSDTLAIPQGDIYNESSLQEVMEIPSPGTTQVCVTPLNTNTRLKVRYTDTEGRTQEVHIKKKLLTENKLNLLDIEVQTSDDSKQGFSVHLNGTQLSIQDVSRSPTSPAPQEPRTALLLKGHAKIRYCPAVPEVRGGEIPQTVTQQQVGEETTTVTQLQKGEETTTVTQRQKGEETTTVTQRQEGEETTTATQRQKGEEVTTSSASSVPSFPSTDASFNCTSEEPESDGEDPWWGFLLVLGKVGEVPVLALLLGGVFLGAVFGAIVVCFCSKACEKRRVVYSPVPAQRTQSLAKNDYIRGTDFWDAPGARSSGIGSAFSTLTNDNGSRMGTGGRPSQSANNSMDRSTVSSTHPSVNNLGKGTTGSPSGSSGRGHNSTTNTLNIPNGSMSRYGSYKSTGHSDNRDMESGSMLLHGSGRIHTFSHSSTGSSLNRNTNRSPNIPYTKTLGTLTGHQDSSMILKHNVHHDDSDSDDSNYDKPYVSRPVVAENYSVPVSQIVTLERPTNTITADPGKPVDRQVPPSQYATFGK